MIISELTTGSSTAGYADEASTSSGTRSWISAMDVLGGNGRAPTLGIHPGAVAVPEPQPRPGIREVQALLGWCPCGPAPVPGWRPAAHPRRRGPRRSSRTAPRPARCCAGARRTRPAGRPGAHPPPPCPEARPRSGACPRAPPAPCPGRAEPPSPPPITGGTGAPRASASERLVGVDRRQREPLGSRLHLIGGVPAAPAVLLRPIGEVHLPDDGLHIERRLRPSAAGRAAA